MTIGERIKNRRKELGISAEQLSDIIDKSRATIYRYENGDIEDMPTSVLEPIAKALHTTPSYLMGWEKNIDMSSITPLTRQIPILGKIAAGQPIEAIEDVIGYAFIDEQMKGEFIALRIDGNSMSPKIPNGSTVIIRLQDDAESGDIVAVYINGYDATCKRLKKLENGGIVLISLNPEYEPMAYTKQEVLDLPIRIIGKIVEVRTKV